MIRREKREVLVGVRAAAKKCGVSACHMSMVLNGKRKAGPELTKRMKRYGVAV